MEKKFLVSFCNNKKLINKSIGYMGQLSVNTQSQTLNFTNIPLVLPNSLSGNGVTGVCFFQGQWVILLQKAPSVLVFLDTNFNYLDHKILEGLFGVHSITCDEKNIYLSVTSQDRIIALDTAMNQQTIWGKGSNKDTIHLNSICLYDNNLFATAFGAKESTLWSSAQTGYAFDISSDSKFITNIWHPHSLTNYEGNFYCCDSSNQRVIGQNKEILLTELPGYSRGLYIDDSLIICGNSFGRQVSHSTGIRISNKSDQGVLAGSCGITVHFKNKSNTVYFDLVNTATEIFEVICCDPRF